MTHRFDEQGLNPSLGRSTFGYILEIGGPSLAATSVELLASPIVSSVFMKLEQ